jgi:hypothetical protein
MRHLCHLLIFLAAAPAAGASTLGERLAERQLKLSLGGSLPLVSESKADGGALSSEELVAEKEGRRVRVVITKGAETAVANLLRGRRRDILEAYLPRNLGNGKFDMRPCRPRPLSGAGHVAFKLLADERFRFGVCGKPAAKHAAVALFAKCPWGAVEVYYFYPMVEPEKPVLSSLRAFGCGGKTEDI